MIAVWVKIPSSDDRADGSFQPTSKDQFPVRGRNLFAAASSSFYVRLGISPAANGMKAFANPCVEPLRTIKIRSDHALYER